MASNPPAAKPPIRKNTTVFMGTRILNVAEVTRSVKKKHTKQNKQKKTPPGGDTDPKKDMEPSRAKMPKQRKQSLIHKSEPTRLRRTP